MSISKKYLYIFLQDWEVEKSVIQILKLMNNKDDKSKIIKMIYRE